MNSMLENPQFMKQQSNLWMEFHKGFKITDSTMYSALGLHTLKDQKDHYRQFIKKEAVEQEITPAMEHGTKHEVCIRYSHFNEPSMKFK